MAAHQQHADNHHHWHKRLPEVTKATGGVETHWFVYNNSDQNSSDYPAENAYKVTNRSDFYLTDSYHGSNILLQEAGDDDHVFIRMYSNLIIPDIAASETHTFKLRAYTDDGVEVWVDKGSGYESVIRSRRNQGKLHIHHQTSRWLTTNPFPSKLSGGKTQELPFLTCNGQPMAPLGQGFQAPRSFLAVTKLR